MEGTLELADCELARGPRATRPGPRRLLRRFVQINAVGLIAVAVWFRCWDLGHVPGVNGDEAWYGVQAELVLQGQPIDWRTPTGNLLNPLFFGPQLLLHAIFQPSFALLRATAVISGILALVVNYWFCRRLFGRRAAVISTIILAVLPINIVYSRLAWDASQSLFVALLTSYFAMHAIVNRPWRTWWSAAALVTQAVAIVVHPTNVFIAPIVGSCLLTAWSDELGTAVHAMRALVARMTRGAPRHAQRALLLGAIGIVSVLTAVGTANWPRGQQAFARLIHPADYLSFGVNLLRLFSGATVFEYVSGSVPPHSNGAVRWDVVAFDVAAGLTCVVAGIGVVPRFVARRRPMEASHDALDDQPDRQYPRLHLAIRALVAGWGLSLAAFFLLAGPAAIAPHFERYGISLVGPGAILAALGLEGWIAQIGLGASRRRRIAATAAIAGAGLLLTTFQVEFFAFFRQTGGLSHPTFRTGAVEPKQAALDYIFSHSHGRIRIAASEWWNYWPLRYLAGAQSPRSDRHKIDVDFAPDVAQRPGENDADLWQVEFADGPASETFRQRQRNSRISISEATISDYSGRPLLSLFRIEAGCRFDSSDRAGSAPDSVKGHFGEMDKKD
jgi:4-amino-4-deoxy-L-arabinose transferase-like glycosyltransferase